MRTVVRPAVPAPLRRPVVMVAVLAAAALAVLGARYSATGTPGRIDRWVQATVDAQWAPWRHIAALVIDYGGEPLGAAALVAVLVTSCLLLGRRRLAVVAVLGTGTAVVTTTALKPVVGRTIHGDFLAFPSGHTALATSLAVVLALLVVDLLRAATPVAVSVLTLVAGAAGAAMAWSQVSLVVHYPTDTVGGFCTALAVVPVAALLTDRIADRSAAADRPAGGGRHL